MKFFNRIVSIVDPIAALFLSHDITYKGTQKQQHLQANVIANFVV